MLIQDIYKHSSFFSTLAMDNSLVSPENFIALLWLCRSFLHKTMH